jgi:hypothetical protein
MIKTVLESSPMQTLLASNRDAALVGDDQGNVQTVNRLPAQTDEEWARHLRDYYFMSDHCDKAAATVPLTRVVDPVVSTSATGGYFETIVEHFAFQEYKDHSVGLSVRAAFVKYWFPEQWVVSKQVVAGNA